jgi:hypothetical protein
MSDEHLVTDAEAEEWGVQVRWLIEEPGIPRPDWTRVVWLLLATRDTLIKVLRMLVVDAEVHIKADSTHPDDCDCLSVPRALLADLHGEKP